VLAVDRADLEPGVAAMPGVAVRRESAFGLAPEPVDWLFSDVIAYPNRLLALVQRWIAAGAPRHIVCTLKFQGATDTPPPPPSRQSQADASCICSTTNTN